MGCIWGPDLVCKAWCKLRWGRTAPLAAVPEEKGLNQWLGHDDRNPEGVDSGGFSLSLIQSLLGNLTNVSQGQCCGASPDGNLPPGDTKPSLTTIQILAAVVSSLQRIDASVRSILIRPEQFASTFQVADFRLMHIAAC